MNNGIIIDGVAYRARFTKDPLRINVLCDICEFPCKIVGDAPCRLFKRSGHFTYLQKEK